jgi:hypothetical protein
MNQAPDQSAPIPANEFERFLANLAEPQRETIRTRLSGSGLSADHPVFAALADFYEKSPPKTEPTQDFYQEALLHSTTAKQLLADFRDLPTTISGRIDARFQELLTRFTAPVEKLERTSTDLTRNVEALPVLLLSNRRRSTPMPQGFWNKLGWITGRLLETIRTLFTDHRPWLAAVVTSLCATALLTAAALAFGAHRLAGYYEQSYQERLAHMQADSLENTMALNRLLAAGLTLKVERSKDQDAYYLILLGAHKAAQPINSPEGLAVEVWP